MKNVLSCLKDAFLYYLLLFYIRDYRFYIINLIVYPYIFLKKSLQKKGINQDAPFVPITCYHR